MMKDPAEILLWAKYQFFERGIGPEEFGRTQMRDIKDIMHIKNAVKEKQLREETVQEMVESMK